MKVNSNDYGGIYSDMVEVLGEDITLKVYNHYRGQQITFPMRIYSRDYVVKYLLKNYDGTNLKQLARELGYSERWTKQLIDKNLKR